MGGGRGKGENKHCVDKMSERQQKWIKEKYVEAGRKKTEK